MLMIMLLKTAKKENRSERREKFAGARIKEKRAHIGIKMEQNERGMT